MLAVFDVRPPPPPFVENTFAGGFLTPHNVAKKARYKMFLAPPPLKGGVYSSRTSCGRISGCFVHKTPPKKGASFGKNTPPHIFGAIKEGLCIPSKLEDPKKMCPPCKVQTPSKGTSQNFLVENPLRLLFRGVPTKKWTFS